MANKGILQLEQVAGEDLDAHAASLHMVVEGKKLFGASAAMARSEEVRALVEALQEAGVASEDIKMEQVHAKRDDKGLISKSTVIYRLRAVVRDLSRLPAALGAAVDAKACQLEHIDWIHDAEPLRRELAARALRTAREKAEAMAAALDQQITGVKRIGEGPGRSHSPRFGATTLAAARGAGKELDLGMELVNSRREEVMVNVTFKIAPLPAKET